MTRIAEEASLSSAAGFSLGISYLVPSLKLREMRRKKKSRRSSIQREQKAIRVERVRISFRAKIKLELNHSTFLKAAKPTSFN